MNLEDFDDGRETICAISSPSGIGGIAIVRLSGSGAISIAEKMVRLRSKRQLRAMKSWSAALGDIVSFNNETVDEAVILLMKGPMSYTGEDIVEIQCHGGVLVAEKVVSTALKHGARPAAAGEFTKRAFLNGRITLDEAEAVLDVITSASESSLVQASQRLKGELGSMVKKWENEIVDILAQLLGAIDFPENVEFERADSEEALEKLAEDIKAVLNRAPLGLALSGGVEVCLVGRPNVGKSSLFNALLSDERAIVTEIPGTTRDVLSERTQWYGLPVVLLDTAGLRETSEVIEAMGVERAKSAAQASNVILYVLDDAEGIVEEDIECLTKWRGRRCLAVASKDDLGKRLVSANELACCFEGDLVRVSSVTGKGIEDLKKRVQSMFTSLGDVEAIAPGSARQVDCLERAFSAVYQALGDLKQGWTDDVVVLSLEEAARALMELTGKVVSSETLDRIFSRFCVGK